MWNRTVRCELEKVEGTEGKRQPTGNVDRTYRLRSCREQGTAPWELALCLLKEAKPSSWV